MITLILITSIFLLVMALMDIVDREIPSVLPTTAILFITFYFVALFPSHILYGILGFIFAWLLYEFDFYRGIADMKAVIIISLFATSVIQFGVFMLLTVGLSLIYQLIFKYGFRYKRKEIPFIPLFFIIFCIFSVLIYYI